MGPIPKQLNQNLQEINNRTLNFEKLSKTVKDNCEILAKGGQKLATKSLPVHTSDR